MSFSEKPSNPPPKKNFTNICIKRQSPSYIRIFLGDSCKTNPPQPSPKPSPLSNFLKYAS